MTAFLTPCNFLILSEQLRNAVLAEKLLFFKLREFRVNPRREFLVAILKLYEIVLNGLKNSLKHTMMPN
jgi:hypothetical protein